jgi:1,4-alpha-glucan branching enzyme
MGSSPPSPIQPIAERHPALEEAEVVLTFYAPDAESVEVAGNFNGWRPGANPLAHEGTGEWFVRLALKSGRYEYRFVVDGVWADDPKATETVSNLHGGSNSILKVRLDDRTELL